jgi:glycosyltransferase involved in cell wall biosynthesis
LTVTHAVKAQLEGELGAKNVIVTPNGVVAPSPVNRQPPTANSFLYVGNDKPHKNVDALIEAFALVRKEIEGRLVLVGAPFERFRSREGVDARGFVEDDELSSLYCSAIALVMPSLEEGFGLPTAEAMAHGAAVITSNDAALVEVTGDAALHVEARDVRALADSMTRIARDEELRVQLASNGIERARMFTWKRCAELTRDAYRAAKIVEHRGTSGSNYDFDKQKLDNID